MPPEKKNSATKERGVGTRCNILLKYLHPQQSIVLNNTQKVKVQGEPDGFFDKKLDLPIIANAQTTVGNLNKRIDTSVIDKMDIALACSQRLDVDDDNGPSLENFPAAGALIDNTTNLYGQKWGWSGSCHQKLSVISIKLLAPTGGWPKFFPFVNF
ncbi:hypothetical protein FRACYDRAFT_241223 [Fragilariopsis cylindrus CCMP1102]|uniref:Uncharacterized protein n=1 Tax=Fragilariopsis cylindrus CCMP1102 TaxID=635003 RepID=A0A1E7F916_9STRA|nr:hypothetical protein FRACYDRAFT_241223 [Fragilariopsis cylindrus CCMP1102]|eukprot:OEU14671.1 hypothetical protein FRACYDRAFT_241223 [Fragilariopsis cylindrus CCMP1102]